MKSVAAAREQSNHSCMKLARLEATKVEQRMKMHRRLGMSLFLVAGGISMMFAFITIQQSHPLSISSLYTRVGCLMVALGIAKFFYYQYRLDSEDYKRLLNVLLQIKDDTNSANGESQKIVEAAKPLGGVEGPETDWVKKMLEKLPSVLGNGKS